MNLSRQFGPNSLHPGVLGTELVSAGVLGTRMGVTLVSGMGMEVPRVLG